MDIKELEIMINEEVKDSNSTLIDKEIFKDHIITIIEDVDDKDMNNVLVDGKRTVSYSKISVENLRSNIKNSLYNFDMNADRCLMYTLIGKIEKYLRDKE